MGIRVGVKRGSGLNKVKMIKQLRFTYQINDSVSSFHSIFYGSRVGEEKREHAFRRNRTLFLCFLFILCHTVGLDWITIGELFMLKVLLYIWVGVDTMGRWICECYIL